MTSRERNPFTRTAKVGRELLDQMATDGTRASIERARESLARLSEVVPRLNPLASVSMTLSVALLERQIETMVECAERFGVESRPT